MKRLGNKSTRSDELQGVICNTDSEISVSKISVSLDSKTAWALCNVLNENYLSERYSDVLTKDQYRGIVSLGQAIGAVIDHPNRNFKHLE